MEIMIVNGGGHRAASESFYLVSKLRSKSKIAGAE
jgi:hypothetical protein